VYGWLVKNIYSQELYTLHGINFSRIFSVSFYFISLVFFTYVCVCVCSQFRKDTYVNNKFFPRSLFIRHSYECVKSFWVDTQVVLFVSFAFFSTHSLFLRGWFFLLPLLYSYLVLTLMPIPPARQHQSRRNAQETTAEREKDHFVRFVISKMAAAAAKQHIQGKRSELISVLEMSKFFQAFGLLSEKSSAFPLYFYTHTNK
jgi:hypothetical protein